MGCFSCRLVEFTMFCYVFPLVSALDALFTLSYLLKLAPQVLNWLPSPNMVVLIATAQPKFWSFAQIMCILYHFIIRKVVHYWKQISRIVNIIVTYSEEYISSWNYCFKFEFWSLNDSCVNLELAIHYLVRAVRILQIVNKHRHGLINPFGPNGIQSSFALSG
jgi:hypothetical protein